LVDTFNRLKNWILQSGLVINDLNNPNHGGVNSYFDEKKGEFGFVYPEITGYFLSSLRFLNSIESNSNYVKLSHNSAQWLLQLTKNHSGIIQGISSDKSKQQLVYSFDTGMCAKGFLDCYEMTKKSEYLTFASNQLNWLIDEAINADGTIKPFKNISTNSFEIDNSIWYKQKGCLHIKLAMPILQLYQLTNENKFLDIANLVCNNYKKLQNIDGSFSIHFGSKVVHLHTMCYALEGLIYAYYVTKNLEYLKSIERALDWCSKQIDEDGSIQLWFNSKYQHAKTSYHIAQLIRLMLLVNSIHNSKKYSNDIKSLLLFLISLQANSTNKKIDGGFYEEFYKSFIGWKKRLRINSWGSMFALQAIRWEQNPLQFEDEIQFLY